MAQETALQAEAREYVTGTVRQAFLDLKNEIDQEPERLANVTEKPNWPLGHVTLAVHNRNAAIPGRDIIFVIAVFGHLPGTIPHVDYEASGDGIRPKLSGEFLIPGTHDWKETEPDQVRDYVRGIYDEAMRVRSLRLNNG